MARGQAVMLPAVRIVPEDFRVAQKNVRIVPSAPRVLRDVLAADRGRRAYFLMRWRALTDVGPWSLDKDVIIP
jgi:hypothetical protein